MTATQGKRVSSTAGHTHESELPTAEIGEEFPQARWGIQECAFELYHFIFAPALKGRGEGQRF